MSFGNTISAESAIHSFNVVLRTCGFCADRSP
jgi:hypothetical protein